MHRSRSLLSIRCRFISEMRSFCSMMGMMGMMSMLSTMGMMSMLSMMGMMSMSMMVMSMIGKLVLCSTSMNCMMDMSRHMGWSKGMVNRHEMNGILDCMQVNDGYVIWPAIIQTVWLVKNLHLKKNFK